MRSTIGLIGVALAVLVLGCAREPARPRGDAESERFKAMFARGYVPGRSGQLFVVPDSGCYFATRTDTLHHFMHGSPWAYDSHIPLLFYGPRFVRAGTFTAPASLQDVAPTLLALAGKQAPATMTGKSLADSIATGRATPAVIVLIVLDGMGRPTWDHYVDSLRTLSQMRHDGAWFEHAALDYLPSVTATGHATVSSGTDPHFNGIPGNAIYTSDGQSDPFKGMSPDSLEVPTVADEWNADTLAHIVVQGTSTRATVTLAGHGAGSGKTRRVVVAMLGESTPGWKKNEKRYVFPKGLSEDTTATFWARYKASARSWSEFLRTRWLPRLQIDALVGIVKQEGLGRDSIPDLLLINFKTPDYASHEHGPLSDDVRQALRELDAQLGRLRDTLAMLTGERGYVMAITADHGMPTDTSWAGRTFTARSVCDSLRAHFGVDSTAVLPFYDASSNQFYVDLAQLERQVPKRPPLRTLDLMRDYLEQMKLASSDRKVFRCVFTADELAKAQR